MSRLLIAVGVAAVAIAVAAVLRRRPADAPSRPDSWQVPAQLDRAEFAEPDAPWLVVVFTSATCNVCASMAAKAAVLRSEAVAVQEVEFTAARSLHERYGIEAVPTTVVVDAQGVVRESYLGPVSATDLWAGVAAVRDPSSRVVDRCQRHEGGPTEPSH